MQVLSAQYPAFPRCLPPTFSWELTGSTESPMIFVFLRSSSATWRRSSLSSTAEIRRSSGSRSIRSAPTRRWAADIEETQGTAPIEPALLIFYKNPLVPPCEEEGLKSINNGHNRDR